MMREALSIAPCTLCPRACGAMRDARSGAGLCRMPTLPVVARAALHHWEEPPISGTKGAGTVFFSGCSLQCVYCQNYPISQDGVGQAVSTVRLRELFQELIAQGAHNIDLVNPGHFAHAAAEALQDPLPVPVVWNSGGYDSVSTLQALKGRVQIYLPDLKYLDQAGAGAYSNAADYPQIATAAILEMVRQRGPCVLDDRGLLQSGVLIRHLLLPGRVHEAKKVMDWVAETFAPGTVLFSLMSQYVPLGKAEACPAINRRLRKSEITAAISYMAALSLEGYVQEESAATAYYVPMFDCTGI